MRFIDEFRDPETARGLATGIAAEADPGRRYHFMEFCGGHTHALYRYGLVGMLPESVRMIHGPGCPVCVLPVGRLDHALCLAQLPEVTLLSFGDMLRVPGSGGLSLLGAKAQGADVRMVYSPTDALRFAVENPARQAVFFAIGFETTTPPTAAVLERARAEGLSNFSVFCNHVLTPAALGAILASDPGDVSLDGFVGPAHVSTITGTAAFEPVALEHQKPVVIAGFEPLDILLAIRKLVAQVNEGRHEVENEYSRAVSREGNHKAQNLVARVFERRNTFAWRGLGEIPASALTLRGEFAAFDAEERFDVSVPPAQEPAGCACADVLRGRLSPPQCALFGTACTPEAPVGACMVSAEGACAAFYAYQRSSV